MRLVVLDTNVVVSAAIKSNGAPARLMMDWVFEGQVQVVTCPWIVAEYREVVRRPKFSRYGFPPQWIQFLIDESLHLPDPPDWPLSGPDPKDLPFLALAHAAGAWLVTGNLKHFPQHIRNGVSVVAPMDYLDHLMRGVAGAGV
jgi:putative PIN family toxin of toxin-antitoxin system